MNTSLQFPVLQYSHVGKSEHAHIFPQVTFLDPRIKELFDLTVDSTDFRPSEAGEAVGYRELAVPSTPEQFVGLIAGYEARDYACIGMSFKTLLRELAVRAVGIDRGELKRMQSPAFVVRDKHGAAHIMNAEYVLGSWSVWLFSDIRAFAVAALKQYGPDIVYCYQGSIFHLPPSAT
jgi:hypothetical protein